jgi:hypothetical protein
LESKDAAMQTCGVWIIELSELNSLSHSEIGRIKAFMSRTMDRFRPPYGMRLVESPTIDSAGRPRKWRYLLSRSWAADPGQRELTTFESRGYAQ